MPIGIIIIELWAAFETVLFVWIFATHFRQFKMCLCSSVYWSKWAKYFLIYIGG